MSEDSRRHSDDLSLEKLKINERLHNVELQVARLVAHMESEVGTFQRIQSRVDENFNRIMQVIERHDKLLFGNGNPPGLLTKMDRIEQTEEDRKWHFRAIWGSVAAVAAKLAYDMFARRS